MKKVGLLIGAFAVFLVGASAFDVYEYGQVRADTLAQASPRTETPHATIPPVHKYQLAITPPQDNQDWTLLNSDPNDDSKYDVPYVTSDGENVVARVNKGDVRLKLSSTDEATVVFQPDKEVVMYLPKGYFSGQ